MSYLEVDARARRQGREPARGRGAGPEGRAAGEDAAADDGRAARGRKQGVLKSHGAGEECAERRDVSKPRAEAQCSLDRIIRVPPGL